MISLLYSRVAILPNARRHSQPASPALLLLSSRFFSLSLSVVPQRRVYPHVANHSNHSNQSIKYHLRCTLPRAGRLEERHLDVHFLMPNLSLSLSPSALSLSRAEYYCYSLYACAGGMPLFCSYERGMRRTTRNALIYIYIYTPIYVIIAGAL